MQHCKRCAPCDPGLDGKAQEAEHAQTHVAYLRAQHVHPPVTRSALQARRLAGAAGLRLLLNSTQNKHWQQGTFSRPKMNAWITTLLRIGSEIS